MSQKISIGRIVHAVIMVSGSLVERPAIVTRTWGDDSTAVQATVFPDAANDMLGDTLAKSSLEYDETGQKENSWHWPQPPASAAKPKGSSSQVDWVGLYAQTGDLCVAIEKLPASGQGTDLSIQASCLLARIREASKPLS